MALTCSNKAGTGGKKKPAYQTLVWKILNGKLEQVAAMIGYTVKGAPLKCSVIQKQRWE